MLITYKVYKKRKVNKYLKATENRGEKAVSMNVFLNTVLPVATKILRNRDDVNADVFEFFTGGMDSTKDVMGYTDYLSFVGGEPLMIAKQIYDKIFSYALSGVDLWEKSLIDDVLEEDGLLDKKAGISNDNSGDVADTVLSLADIALSLIDKGKIGTSVSRNLYSSAKKESKEAIKKEVVKDTVSETGKQVLKKETKKFAKNITEKTVEVAKNITEENKKIKRVY